MRRKFVAVLGCAAALCATCAAGGKEPATLAQTILADGPAAYYDGSESAGGTWLDRSGYGRDGAIENPASVRYRQAALASTSRYSLGLNLTSSAGAPAALKAPDSLPNENGAFSFVEFVRIAQTPAPDTNVAIASYTSRLPQCGGAGWWFGDYGNPLQLQLYLGTRADVRDLHEETVFGQPLAPGVNYSFGVSYDGKRFVKVFVDGVLSGALDLQGRPYVAQAGSHLTAGIASCFGRRYPLRGYVGDVAYFTRALADARFAAYAGYLIEPRSNTEAAAATALPPPSGSRLDAPFAKSPFNVPIPPAAPADPHSSRIIALLASYDVLSGRDPPALTIPNIVEEGTVLRPPRTSKDYGFPVYYTASRFPGYEVRCRLYCGIPSSPPLVLHIPPNAEPEPGNNFAEGHLAVIDLDRKPAMEYDFWEARLTPAADAEKGGVLYAESDGQGPLDGDGLNFVTTHAGFALTLGVLRPADILARSIPHALQIGVPCADNPAYLPDRAIYPSAAQTGGPACTEDPSGAPYYGMRVQLKMTDATIDRVAPLRSRFAYLNTIYKALAHYGGFVGDTGGNFSIRLESPQTYAVLGQPNPWLVLAKRTGIRPASDGSVSFPLNAPGVDIFDFLRVVSACVTNPVGHTGPSVNCPAGAVVSAAGARLSGSRGARRL